MKTKIHYGNKVSTVKGNTVFCDTELELFNRERIGSKQYNRHLPVVVVVVTM